MLTTSVHWVAARGRSACDLPRASGEEVSSTFSALVPHSVQSSIQWTSLPVQFSYFLQHQGVYVFLVEAYLICILHDRRLRKPQRNPRTCEGEFEQTIPSVCLHSACQLFARRVIFCQPRKHELSIVSSI